MTIRREREESPVSSPYDMLRELRRMTSEVIALRNGRLYGIEIATAFRELDERLTEGGELPPAWATGRDDAFDREERR